MRNRIRMGRTAAALISLAAVAGASSQVVAAAAGGDAAAGGTERDARCQAQIRRRVTDASAPVDPACWRVGPISIGTARPDVELPLGPAAAPPEAPDGGPTPLTYPTAIYVFPRSLAADLARRPTRAVRFRLLYIDYRDGRVVRIDTDQTYAMSSPRCGPSRSDSTAGSGASGSAPADFAPFTRVAGVHLGSSLDALQRRLGRATTVSTAAYFYAYPPAPVTFHVEPRTAGGRPEVLGFALGSDERTVFLGGSADIRLERDPVSCRFTGYTLRPHEPG